MSKKVVPSMFRLIPTPPLFPTRPPISPAVTADFEVPVSANIVYLFQDADTDSIDLSLVSVYLGGYILSDTGPSSCV